MLHSSFVVPKLDTSSASSCVTRVAGIALVDGQQPLGEELVYRLVTTACRGLQPAQPVPLLEDAERVSRDPAVSADGVDLLPEGRAGQRRDRMLVVPRSEPARVLDHVWYQPVTRVGAGEGHPIRTRVVPRSGA